MLNAVTNNMGMPGTAIEINQSWPLIVSKRPSREYLPEKSIVSLPEKKLPHYHNPTEEIGYGLFELREKGMFIDIFV